jgi:uncharacterized FlaG/YvyC family protein
MIEGIGSQNLSHLAFQKSTKSRQGTGQAEAAKKVEQPKAAELSARDVEALAEDLNKTLSRFDGDYSVSVDDATGMLLLRIKDSAGDIVKQIPPQQVLDARVSVQKIIGLLVNDEA